MKFIEVKFIHPAGIPLPSYVVLTFHLSVDSILLISKEELLIKSEYFQELQRKYGAIEKVIPVNKSHVESLIKIGV